MDEPVRCTLVFWTASRKASTFHSHSPLYQSPRLLSYPVRRPATFAGSPEGISANRAFYQLVLLFEVDLVLRWVRD